MANTNKFKNKTFKESIICAVRGVVTAFRREKNFRIYAIHILVTFPLNLCIGVPVLGHVFYLICLTGILSSEFFNTAIEMLCDAFDTRFNSDIRRIKDVAAAGVIFWGGTFYLVELLTVIATVASKCGVSWLSLI